jgi:hypothetical protein
MDVHDRPEPDNRRHEVQVSDDQAHVLLRSSQGPIESFDLHVFKEIFPRLRERTAADGVYMAVLALKSRLPGIVGSGKRGRWEGQDEEEQHERGKDLHERPYDFHRAQYIVSPGGCKLFLKEFSFKDGQ